MELAQSNSAATQQLLAKFGVDHLKGFAVVKSKDTIGATFRGVTQVKLTAPRSSPSVHHT